MMPEQPTVQDATMEQYKYVREVIARDFVKLVDQRVQHTGESYQQALYFIAKHYYGVQINATRR